MSSCRSSCCLNDLSGSNDAADLCPQRRSPSSCDAFKDRPSNVISICREYEQAAGGLFPHVSRVEPQRRNRHSKKWLLRNCVLCFFLALTFLMGSVGKEDTDVQDYDANVFLLFQVLRSLGRLLFWTILLFLCLLQMFLWLIKGVLWFISISVSPICHCLSFLVSCLLLLLHYMCYAVLFATTSPMYVYGILLSVGVSLLIFTR